VNKDAK
jgi:hypothetical protein